MNKKVQLLLVVVLLSNISIIIGQDNPLKYQSILLDSLMTKDANAIVRSEEVLIEIKAVNSIMVTTKRVVTVLNKFGNKYIDSYESYDPNTKIKKIGAVVYNSFGAEIKKYKKKDFHDQSMYDGFSLIGDRRMLYFNYTPTGYPYTMVYESVIERKSTAFVAPWFPILGENLSVEKSSYSVLNPSKIEIRLKENKFDGYQIEIERGDQEVSYTIANVPALEKERKSPSLKKRVPNAWVALSKFALVDVEGSATDWSTMGKWQHQNLLANRSNLPQETIQKISELVADASTNKEKAKRIYEYVQGKTRYISVQLGIGGWMPMKAEEVDRLGYGDCKALTNYTKALLDSQDIPAYYTVVYAGKKKRDIDPDFASMQGNHVILNIPDENEDIWLECTSQTLPFNFIGDFTDDRNVLVVKPDGGEIKRTKKYASEENSLITKATIYLREDKSILADVETNASGLQYDWRYHTKLKSVKDQKMHFKEYWDYVNNLEIAKMELVDDKDNINYQEKVKVTATNYLTKAGSRLLLKPNVFNRKKNKTPKYKDRKNPVVISRGYIDNDEYIINLPVGYQINTLPKKKVIETVFGSYTCKLEKVTESQLKYTRNLHIKEGTHPKETYEIYRKFISDIIKADNSKIVLNKR